jgi:hypothetical protein
MGLALWLLKVTDQNQGSNTTEADRLGYLQVCFDRNSGIEVGIFSLPGEQFFSSNPLFEENYWLKNYHFGYEMSFASVQGQ